MKRILKRTVETVAEQMRASHFAPEGYEVSFPLQKIWMP